MRKAIVLAVALALAGFAGSASADTSVTTDITANTTWGNAANPCPIILENPIFVRGGATLTILPGCVVRGQPRTAAPLSGSSVGVPGSLIVTRTGRLVAQGTRSAPIIFTTAAIDAAAPFGTADTFTVGPDTFDSPQVCNPSPGICTPSFPYLDDDPAGDPMSVLASNGTQNIGKWGGVAILGNAPTNYSTTGPLLLLGASYGQNILEGVDFPGFPASYGLFGGSDPHDDSGVLEFVSIRHAGDTLNDGDELNCLTLAGLGDGTRVSHVECLGNFDDGFEWFGGTVDGDHLAAFYIGDDTFDLDAGYTGINQFVFGVMPHFNQDSGATYGSRSGDKCTEWDGEDFAEGGNVNTRQNPFDSTGALGLGGQPWPYSNPLFYNFTCIGSTPPANSAASAAAANTGVQMRNGFAGELRNAIVVNTGTSPGLDVVDGDGSSPDWSPALNDAGGFGSNTDKGDVAVICATFDDVGAPGGDGAVAIANGDARYATTTDVNYVNFGPFAGLANESVGYDLSVASGKLADVAGTAIDPRTLNPIASAGCVAPSGPGVDGAATYRGAFEPGAPLWTDGWSAMDAGGKL